MSGDPSFDLHDLTGHATTIASSVPLVADELIRHSRISPSLWSDPAGEFYFLGSTRFQSQIYIGNGGEIRRFIFFRRRQSDRVTLDAQFSFHVSPTETLPPEGELAPEALHYKILNPPFIWKNPSEEEIQHFTANDPDVVAQYTVLVRVGEQGEAVFAASIPRFGNIPRARFYLTLPGERPRRIVDSKGRWEIGPFLEVLETLANWVNTVDQASARGVAPTAMARARSTGTPQHDISRLILQMAHTYTAAIGKVNRVERTFEATTAPNIKFPRNQLRGESAIAVSDRGPLCDVAVKVDIEHSWRSRIILELVSPAGTVVTIYDDPLGGIPGAEERRRLPDDLTAEFTMLNTPRLSEFKRASVFGEWKLQFRNRERNGGLLKSWSIQLTTDHPRPALPEWFKELQTPFAIRQFVCHASLQVDKNGELEWRRNPQETPIQFELAMHFGREGRDQALLQILPPGFLASGELFDALLSAVQEESVIDKLAAAFDTEPNEIRSSFLTRTRASVVIRTKRRRAEGDEYLWLVRSRRRDSEWLLFFWARFLTHESYSPPTATYTKGLDAVYFGKLRPDAKVLRNSDVRRIMPSLQLLRRWYGLIPKI